MRLIFLIGASGSGKTTLAERLEPVLALDEGRVLFFDSILSEEEFSRAARETDEAWQRRMTVEWCRRAAKLGDQVETVVIDGQTRFEFIREGCIEAGLPLAEVILVDCDDQDRTERLYGRSQPHLANEQMISWAAWLRTDALAQAIPVLETSGRSIDTSLAQLLLALRIPAGG